MNRRKFLVRVGSTAILPRVAMAQTPAPEPDEIDMRSRDLLDALTAIASTDLLTALERAPISHSGLNELAMNRGISVPWADFEDRDLRSALGGVMIGDPEDSENGLVGGFIVFESAEIAYEETVLKLKTEYLAPSKDYAAAGTTVWVIGGAGDSEISVARVSYVQIIAIENPDEHGVAMPLLIEHLTDVARSV